MNTSGRAIGPVFIVVGASEHAEKLARLLGAELFEISPYEPKVGVWVVDGVPVTDPADANASNPMAGIEALRRSIGEADPERAIVISSQTWLSPNPVWLERVVLIPIGRRLKALVWVRAEGTQASATGGLQFLDYCARAGTTIRQVDSRTSLADPHALTQRLLDAVKT